MLCQPGFSSRSRGGSPNEAGQGSNASPRGAWIENGRSKCATIGIALLNSQGCHRTWRLAAAANGGIRLHAPSSSEMPPQPLPLCMWAPVRLSQGQHNYKLEVQPAACRPPIRACASMRPPPQRVSAASHAIVWLFPVYKRPAAELQPERTAFRHRNQVGQVAGLFCERAVLGAPCPCCAGPCMIRG